jgi:hypothetical protein
VSDGAIKFFSGGTIPRRMPMNDYGQGLVKLFHKWPGFSDYETVPWGGQGSPWSPTPVDGFKPDVTPDPPPPKTK